MVTIEKLDKLAPPIVRRKIRWHKDNLQNKVLKGCECGGIPLSNSFNRCNSCVYGVFKEDMRIACISADYTNYNGVL